MFSHFDQVQENAIDISQFRFVKKTICQIRYLPFYEQLLHFPVNV